MCAPVSRITLAKNSLLGGFPSFRRASCQEGLWCVPCNHVPQNSQGPCGSGGPASGPLPLPEALPLGGDYKSPGPRGEKQIESRVLRRRVKMGEWWEGVLLDAQVAWGGGKDKCPLFLLGPWPGMLWTRLMHR